MLDDIGNAWCSLSKHVPYAKAQCCWTWPIIKTVSRSLIEKSRIAKVSERLDEMPQITQVRDFKDVVCNLVLSNQSSQSRIDAEQFSLIYFRKISGPRSPVFSSKPYYWSFDEEAQYVVLNFT